jgi:hypothetical protein
LLSRNISSLFQLYEITELLNYYNKLSIEEQKALRLKRSRDNSINYKELRNILFEIFINYYLQKNNLNPSFIDSYYDNKGRQKPLDSSFIFNGEKYIVECKKLYSEKYAIFREFAARIALKFKKRGEKQTVYTDEMVSGYIVLKTDKDLKITLNKAEQGFNEIFKKYFHSLKNKSDEIIKIPPRIENDKYIICIEPDFSGKYENEYPNSLSKYDYYVKFYTRANDFIQGQSKANLEVCIKHKKVSHFVSEKVKEKIKQHHSFGSHRIIFIEIENTNIQHKDGYSIPLRKDNLDINEFAKHINDKTSIVFVLKSVTTEEIKYDVGVLKNSNFDYELSMKLENILKNYCA